MTVGESIARWICNCVCFTVCLPDSVLAFHKNGMQGRSLRNGEITQEITDGSRTYRLLGSDKYVANLLIYRFYTSNSFLFKISVFFCISNLGFCISLISSSHEAVPHGAFLYPTEKTLTKETTAVNSSPNDYTARPPKTMPFASPPVATPSQTSTTSEFILLMSPHNIMLPTIQEEVNREVNDHSLMTWIIELNTVLK